MNVITFQIMKFNKTFLVSLRFALQLQWAAPLYFPALWQWSLTFSSSMSFSHIQHMLLDQRFSYFLVMIKCLLKMLFHYFFTVFVLFKNCLNKSISSISTFINNNWFNKFITYTNKLVRKTARNLILIFFCVKTFIAFNTF